MMLPCMIRTGSTVGTAVSKEALSGKLYYILLKAGLRILPEFSVFGAVISTLTKTLECVSGSLVAR